MCNWFKKMFGGKCCCQKHEEAAPETGSAPINMENNQAGAPEAGQPENVAKPQ